MPKRKVARKQAKTISQRLRALAQERYGSLEKFRSKLGVARTTGIAWFGGRHPSVPEVPFLLHLAENTNVSLNWLLLGEGPQLRQRQTVTDKGRLLATIEAELRASEDATDEEFEEVWNRMVI